MELSRGSGHFRGVLGLLQQRETAMAVPPCEVGDAGHGGYEAHMPRCGAVAPAGSLWEVDGKAGPRGLRLLKWFRREGWTIWPEVPSVFSSSPGC